MCFSHQDVAEVKAGWMSWIPTEISHSNISDAAWVAIFFAVNVEPQSRLYNPYSTRTMRMDQSRAFPYTVYPSGCSDSLHLTITDMHGTSTIRAAADQPNKLFKAGIG